MTNQRSDFMSTISAYNSSTIGTLFSSLNTSGSVFGTSSSSASGLYGSLADYASIRSGNYYQLMKSYYSEVVNSDSSSSSTSSKLNSTSTSLDSTSTIAKIENAATDMNDAAAALLKNGTSSAFGKTSSTDSDGHTTTSYNTDKIYKAVNSFVDSYNSLLSQSGSSKDSSISSANKSLISMTKGNESLLNSVGISIDSKTNKLSIDETVFKKADMSVAKSLFNGAGSYGYQVSAKASMINYYAQNEALKANTYSNSGTYTYNYSTGEIYNTTT